MFSTRSLVFSFRAPVLGAVLLGLLGALTSGLASAQARADDCARRTSSNASIILPADLEVVVEGSALRRVEVAVYTSQGICVGSTLWAGEAAGLVAWGTGRPVQAVPVPDEVSPDEVLAPGDTMHVRLFDPTTGRRYAATNGRVDLTFRTDAPYLKADARYVPNGIYVLDRIRAHEGLADRE